MKGHIVQSIFIENCDLVRPTSPFILSPKRTLLFPLIVQGVNG